MKLTFETEAQAARFIEDNPHLELIDSDGDRYYFNGEFVIHCSSWASGLCSRNNHALLDSFIGAGGGGGGGAGPYGNGGGAGGGFAKFKVTLKGTKPSKNDVICAIFKSKEDFAVLRGLNLKKQFKVCAYEEDGLLRCIISKPSAKVVANES